MPNDVVENRGLRESVREYLAGRYKPVCWKRSMRIIDGFPTVSAFARANKGEWLKKYHESRPNSTQDLGKLTIKALEDAVAFVKEGEYNKRLDAELAQRKAEEDAKEEARKNPRFTIAELKAIASLMEVCGFTEIDLHGIKDILSKMSIKLVESENKPERGL